MSSSHILRDKERRQLKGPQVYKEHRMSQTKEPYCLDCGLYADSDEAESSCIQTIFHHKKSDPSFLPKPTSSSPSSHAREENSLR